MTGCIKKILKQFLVMGLLTLSVVGCSQKDQLTGMYPLNFSITPVCQAQQKLINFTNSSGEEIVLSGAVISLGSDPYQNFNLEGILINGRETKSNAGRLGEVHIPAGATYAFEIKYAPTQERMLSTAYIDVVYAAPKEGIVQIAVAGQSATRENCQSQQPGGGPLALNGAVNIHVTRMVAATSLIAGAINTDQGMSPFVPIDLPATLTVNSSDHAQSTISLPAYTRSDFILPAPGPTAPTDIRNSGIEHQTIMTILEDATGTYNPDNGSVVVNNVIVQMAGDFRAKLRVNLTTEELNNTVSPALNGDALRGLISVGAWDATTRKFRGQRINSAQNNSIVLVGLTNPFDVEADGQLALLDGSSMGVVIFANVLPAQ